ncbi:MAG TPA: DUF3419 family protein [Myxococcota bacterium]|jgi:S-adenosylmethionine-diacylglycerol 3-amino-3-carboxypropyl transferase
MLARIVTEESTASELRSPAADVLATRLSYAQCWEDAGILQEALQVGPDDDVLSIASAGDNSFALAIAGAKSVTAIDLSFPQLAVTELKLVATSLDYHEFTALLGAAPERNRRGLYQKIRADLSVGARDYWDAHGDTLDAGLIHAGRFERYLALFRTRLLPFIHSRRTVDAFCALASVEEQRAFFRERWDNWRFRGLVRLFFSRPVMARLGRSREHFAQVQGEVSAQFLARAQHAFTEISIANNPYLQLMLRGRFLDLERAHAYLTRAGHAKLREVRPRIRIVLAELEKHLPAAKAGAYSAFNYSNLFEYMPASSHETLLKLSVAAARPGARIAYWNLLVPRSRPASMADVLERKDTSSLLARDRAFVYGGFQLETVTRR